MHDLLSGVDVQLTKEHLDQYQEQGYVVVENVFGEETVNALQNESDRVLELVVNSSMYHDRTSERLDLIESENGVQMVRKIRPVLDLSLLYSSVEEMLSAAVEQLMEESPQLLDGKVNYKQPLPSPITEIEAPPSTSAYAIHNDWAHFKSYSPQLLTTAVMIDDQSVERGALRFWPGTHTEHREHAEQEDGPIHVPESEIDVESVDITTPAGSVVFFNSFLLHSSYPNESGHPRRLLIYRHQPKSDAETDFHRNTQTALREAPYEWEYTRVTSQESTTPSFSAPSTRD